jgi:hypothetical protein
VKGGIGVVQVAEHPNSNPSTAKGGTKRDTKEYQLQWWSFSLPIFVTKFSNSKKQVLELIT